MNSYPILMSAILSFAPVAAQSQTAQVTFYSTAPVANQLKPGAKSAFYGNIFDGTVLLARMEHNRFITFALPVGPHVFSAAGKHPDLKNTLNIDLAPAQHYFVRSSFSANFYSLKLPHGNLEKVDCATAQAEAATTSPILMKGVLDQAKSAQVDLKSFPSC